MDANSRTAGSPPCALTDVDVAGVNDDDGNDGGGGDDVKWRKLKLDPMLLLMMISRVYPNKQTDRERVFRCNWRRLLH